MKQSKNKVQIYNEKQNKNISPPEQCKHIHVLSLMTLMRSSKCFPRLSTIPTLTYKRVNSVVIKNTRNMPNA